MESFNFGAFDPTIGARLANIPQEAQKQQTANMLQAMQMQGAMRQNEMSQMQLDELKSDRAEMIKLQQDLAAKGGSPDLGRLANVLMKSPKYFKLGIELSQKLSAQARFDKLNFGDAPPPTPTEAPANMLPGVVSPPAGITNPPAAPQAQTTIANLNRQIAANMALGTEQGYKYAEMLQKRVDALGKVYTVGTTLMGSEGQIIGTAPEATSQEIRTMRELGYPNTPAGYAAFRDTQRPERLLTPAEQKQTIDIALASRPPAPPRPEQPPVSVVDPDTGKQVLVSREEAITRRMTPANAAEGLAPKEIQRREATFPKATAAVKAFEVSADSLVKDLETLAVHPGLDSITGLLAGRIIGLTSEGRAAKALYDKIVARGGFQELQNVRVASPTGGGLGNVSNQEGTQLKNAFAAVDRTQDAPDVRAALTRAAEETKASKGRVREAYELTYEYRSPLKSAGADKPTLSPADQAALAWAADNPNDPRAAQIKQRLGR